MNICMNDIPGDLDMELAADICKVFKEILVDKILVKNQKYGNSVYEPEGILGELNPCPVDLIAIRVDDKLKRLKTMERCDPKFDSEIKEIIAYLLILLDIKGKKNESTCCG